MSETADIFGQLFGQYTGDKKYDKHGYHCNKCDYELEQLVVQTPLKETKKLFYCKNNRCEKFGMVTVVAKKKTKAPQS